MEEESFEDNVTSSNSRMHTLLMLSPSYNTTTHRHHLSQQMMDAVDGSLTTAPSRPRNTPPNSLIHEMFLLLVERINETIEENSSGQEDGGILPSPHSSISTPSQQHQQQQLPGGRGRGHRRRPRPYSTIQRSATDIISEALAIIESVE